MYQIPTTVCRTGKSTNTNNAYRLLIDARRIEQSQKEIDVSYRSTPTDVLNCRDGHFFGVHFLECALDNVNFDNCILLNVVFDDCSFNNTTWSNIFMQDVRFVGCHFYDYIWQNVKLEDHAIHDEILEHTTENGGAVPEEITDPMWLEHEKNRMNILKKDAKARRVEETKHFDNMSKLHPYVPPFFEDGETESEINAIQNARILGGESNARSMYS